MEVGRPESWSAHLSFRFRFRSGRGRDSAQIPQHHGTSSDAMLRLVADVSPGQNLYRGSGLTSRPPPGTSSGAYLDSAVSWENGGILPLDSGILPDG